MLATRLLAATAYIDCCRAECASYAPAIIVLPFELRLCAQTDTPEPLRLSLRLC